MQTSNVQDSPSFGKIRNFVWPIHNYELKKLVPMFALFFMISFVYNLLRNLKIPLLIKAQGSCPEAIPFVKVGAVLPGAVICTYIFTVLISRFNREQVFYAILGGFLVYFAVFLFVLYPNYQQFQLDTLANFLQTYVFTGEGSKGFIAAIRNLNFTIFYVLCEMWSAVVLSMLFWGFANEVTKMDEAKRFYAIFALGANMSGIGSGMLAHAIKRMPYMEYLPFGPSDQWIFMQMCTVLGVGMVIISMFYTLNRTVFHLENVEALQIPKKARNKLSMRECFSYLRRSRYLAYMVIIVVGYNLVYNLADVMWNYKLDQVYSSSQDYNAYMNQITLITAVIAVVLAFFVSGNVIRRFGWTAAALITPLIWLLTSIGFFSGLVLEGTVVFEVITTFVANPANLVLFMGSMQLCLGRGCKYTVFDEAKEIAFIPLPRENQRKGKAVVDGLASRFGKSGGSFIYIMLFSVLGGVANTIPYVTAIIFVALAAWIYAVIRMGRIVEKAISGEHDLVHLEEGILHDRSRAKEPVIVTAATSEAVPQAN